MKSKHFSRRDFLKHSSILGGSTVISSLVPQLLQAQTGGAPSQRNFVVVSLGHSMDPIDRESHLQWLPTMNADGIDNLAPFMQPLEPFKNKMLAVAGADNVVNLLVDTNGHNGSSRTLLTARPHREFYTQGSRDLGSSSLGGGASIEYEIASRFSQSPLVLRSGVTNSEHRRTFLADGTDDEGNPDPRNAFENLFANYTATPSGSLTPAEQLAARRVDILSSVRDTYEYTAQRAGVADRERLQSHAALVDSFINELDTGAQVLSCSSPEIDFPSHYPSNFSDGSGGSDDVLSRLQNSVIATAFGCGAARVASLHYSTMQSNQFDFLNGGQDLIAPLNIGNWHAVCHHEGGSAHDDIRVRVQTWYSEMLADLLTKLENTPNGSGGTALDNTIVVYTTSLGINWHGHDDIPFIMFGGEHSGLATNQALNLDRRTHADMWASMLQLMGQSDETFGHGGEYQGRPLQNGPVSDLFA